MHSTEYQYIQSSHQSHIFLAHYLPVKRASDQADTQAVILVPPFAEELSRSKRMYVLCARLLANSGFHVICFDYSGTGDSSGEWGEFDYVDWVNDLKTVYQYANNYAAHVNFIALRFGALILADAIIQERLNTNRCIFWDPVEKGEQLTRQLVRMKIAATMADAAKKISSQEVKQSMQDEGFLESGGYHISSTMFDEISSKQIAPSVVPLLDQAHLHWMALGRHKEQTDIWLANSIARHELEEASVGIKLTMHAVNDVKFWMQQEVTLAPKLLQRTHEIFINGE